MRVYKLLLLWTWCGLFCIHPAASLPAFRREHSVAGHGRRARSVRTRAPSDGLVGRGMMGGEPDAAAKAMALASMRLSVWGRDACPSRIPARTASAPSSLCAAHSRNRHRVCSLYTNGVVLGYTRGKRSQSPNSSLLKLEGVRAKDDATFYLGKRVAYIYRAQRAQKGSKIRCIWGRVRLLPRICWSVGSHASSQITRPHGNNGVVRARFASNLPSKSFGASVRVVRLFSLFLRQSAFSRCNRCSSRRTSEHLETPLYSFITRFREHFASLQTEPPLAGASCSVCLAFAAVCWGVCALVLGLDAQWPCLFRILLWMRTAQHMRVLLTVRARGGTVCV